MKKSTWLYGIAISIAVAFVALAENPRTLAASQDSTTSRVEVKIDNFSYSPSAVTVKAGTQVTWTNRDDIPHTVVSSDNGNAFKSKTLDTDEKFSFTPTKPGTYSYFCSIHPKMTARIVVQ